MNQLDLFEKRLKAIIENSLRLFPSTDRHTQLIQQLCEAMQNFILTSSDLVKVNIQTLKIYLNPEDLAEWQKQKDWNEQISKIFSLTLLEFGIKNDFSPPISLISKNSLESGHLAFELVDDQNLNTITSAVPLKDHLESQKDLLSNDDRPRLLVNDKEIIILIKNVTNFGRRSSNDIVINDLRISRTHAQIRKINDSFTIFDAGSAGGVFINGERVTTHRLRSGDVISLAGYTMIFIQETHSETSERSEITTEISTSRKAR
jgi:hypothetical protein